MVKPVLAALEPIDYAPGTALGGPNAQLANLISPLITNVLILSGLLAFIVIIIAGFNYITAGGDKNKTEQAQNMLTYSIMGLVIVAAAFLITRIIGAVIGFKFF